MSNFNEDISNWDTSRVTDLTYMFDVRVDHAPSSHYPLTGYRVTTPPPPQRATAFNQPLTFDTSKVTSMKGMFYVRPRVPPTSSRALLHTCCTRSPSSRYFLCGLV